MSRNTFERVTVVRGDQREVVNVSNPTELAGGGLIGRVVDGQGYDRYRYLSVESDLVTERQLLRWNAAGDLVPTDREPAECGECIDPAAMGWDPIQMVNDAPVIVCEKHLALAPGWAYETDEIRRVLNG